MNNKRKIFNGMLISRDNNGSVAVLISVLIMSAILTASLMAAGIIQNGITMGKSQVHSTKAYFAAEAGLEELLYRIRKDSFNPGCSPVNYISFGGACHPSVPFTVVLPNNTAFYIRYADTSPVTYRSYGEFQDVRRVVEVNY